MGNGKKDKHKKELRRCIYSGKVISKNEEVVLAEKVIEYVKKLGYRVIPEERIELIQTYTALFLCVGALNLIMLQ